MATVNLVDKYAPKMATAFTVASLLAGKSSADFDFIGSETIKVITPVYPDPSPYSRTGIARYGTPTEIGDTVQEMKVTQDMGLPATVDKGNFKQQGEMKSAGRVMKDLLAQKIVPMTDKRALSVWSQNAGKIVGLDTPTKDNIIGFIMDIEVYMSEKGVPEAERYCMVTPAIYKLIRLADEFTSTNDLANKAMKGVIGEIGTLKIMQASMSRLPANCYFLAWQKNSVLLPFQVNDAKYHVDAPGISGVLFEIRYIYDAFVNGTIADGVYAGVATAKKLTASIAWAAKNATFTVTSANSTKVLYTLDGSDPRYSNTAKETTTGTAIAANEIGTATNVKYVGVGNVTNGAYYTSDVGEDSKTQTE